MQTDLAVGMCFYNPFDYEQMNDNLINTLQQLSLQWKDIWIIELLYDVEGMNSKSIEPRCPPNVQVISLHTSSLMWHKEQLLNYLGRWLTGVEGYDAAAMFDADILFTNPDWPQRIITKLEAFKVIQCYSLGQSGWTPDGQAQSIKPSFLKNWFDKQLFYGSYPGGAWAGRREFWQECGFFDLSIVGGGDSAFTAALLGAVTKEDYWINHLATMFQSSPETDLVSPSYQDAYLSYKQILNKTVGASFFYANQEALFQAHGVRQNRCYANRYHLLNNIDIPQELARDANGLTLWTDPKGARAKAIKSYFRVRNSEVAEDFVFLTKCRCIADCYAGGKLYRKGEVYDLPINFLSKHFELEW